jgi:hypothetical protein
MRHQVYHSHHCPRLQKKKKKKKIHISMIRGTDRTPTMSRAKLTKMNLDRHPPQTKKNGDLDYRKSVVFTECHLSSRLVIQDAKVPIQDQTHVLRPHHSCLLRPSRTWNISCKNVISFEEGGHKVERYRLADNHLNAHVE